MTRSISTFVSIVVICIAFACMASADPVIPVQYPFYRQCQLPWANDLMETSTICGEGCAMTSLAMGLAGRGYTLNGMPINPSSLNEWLRENNGYVYSGGDHNNLVLDAPDRLAPNGQISLIGELTKPPVASIITGLQNNIVFAAHVRNKTHFVLIIGWDVNTPNDLLVHDPYYTVDSYSWDDMSDILMWTVLPNTSSATEKVAADSEKIKVVEEKEEVTIRQVLGTKRKSSLFSASLRRLD